ncbi:hypothetical protein LH935_00790 [Gordonia polyisoprenivorans]|uniref:TY-Chap domain-containing protein n=1 Tax=Gordonia polyisoprenivorans TaxID=84595 RepID=UPI00223484F1|nr:hypothetical protein LH935_00790 [Gordonia polyisoprenivorans]
MTTSPEQIITDTWREFTEDLAGRLGDLAPGRFDFLECFRASDRLQLITFRATKPGRIRCTIADDALGDDGHSDAALTSAGFRHHPSRREHVLDITRHQHGVTAVHCIRLLRETWEIPFPTFLLLRDACRTATPFACDAPLYEAATKRHLWALPDLED